MQLERSSPYVAMLPDDSIPLKFSQVCPSANCSNVRPFCAIFLLGSVNSTPETRRNNMIIPHDSVEIVEVGPRDGLQNLRGFVKTEYKVTLIQRLAKSGLREIQNRAPLSIHGNPSVQRYQGDFRSGGRQD